MDEDRQSNAIVAYARTIMRAGGVADTIAAALGTLEQIYGGEHGSIGVGALDRLDDGQYRFTASDALSAAGVPAERLRGLVDNACGTGETVGVVEIGPIAGTLGEPVFHSYSDNSAVAPQLVLSVWPLGNSTMVSRESGIGDLVLSRTGVELSHAATMLGDALTVARELSRLQAESMIDELTGLYNRRGMEASLSRERARFRRGDGKFSVLYIDLDNFKQINDRFGHDVGDRAIRAAARVFSTMLRATDTATRCGGDEFVLVLSDIGHEEATAVAERISATIGRTEITANSGEAINLGGSIGVSSTDEGDGADNILGRADKAMYTAKRQRRSAGQPAAQPTAQQRRYRRLQPRSVGRGRDTRQTVSS